MATPTTSRHADYFASRPVARSRPSGSLAAHTPGSPRTPLLNRSISGQYGSPGSLSREPEEVVIYELHPRSLSAGFAGESKPRCVHRFGYQIGDGRRVGDYRDFTGHKNRIPRRDRNDTRWSAHYELFRADVRQLDLELVADRLERAVRQVHTDYLQLVPARPLKAVLAIPSLLPAPILEIALRVLFQHHAQPPTITLLTTPILCCVSAGLRNALVVEVGWEETTVTAVGEHKIVAERRSVRGGKMLVQQMAALLEDSGITEGVEFTMAEDVTRRMAWCRPRPTSIEGDDPSLLDSQITIPTPNTSLPSLDIPFSTLSNPAETTFFPPITEDEHDASFPALIYNTLLTLPVDLRSLCMSRILLTGPSSNIPGLKTRLLAEFSSLLDKRGWDMVESYGSAKSPLPKRLLERQADAGALPPDANGILPPSSRPHDDLADRLSQQVLSSTAKGRESVVKGVVRGVETLGAWSGASLVASLKVRGKGEVEREEFLRDAGVAMAGLGV